MSRLTRMLESGQKLSRAEQTMVVPLAAALLFAPAVIALFRRAASDPSAWQMWIMAVLATTFVVSVCWGAYRMTGGAGLTWRAWAYALRATAFLSTFGGAWVLVTGRTPGKVASHPVPRSLAINYFLLALGVWVIARGLTTWATHRDGDAVRQTDQGKPLDRFDDPYV